MKKLLAATLIISALLPTTSAKAAVNQCEIPGKYYDSKPVDSAQDLKALQNGTYQARGVKLNQSYKYVKSKLGQPETLEIEKDKEGTMIYAGYGDYEFGFYSPKRYITRDSLKLISIEMYLNDKARMLRRDIIATLGEPTGKFHDEDYALEESFNYLHAKYSEISKGYLAESVAMYHPKYDNHSRVFYKGNFRKNHLKNVAEKLPTITELKAMKNGKYSYKGIKPGMLSTDVYKKVGASNTESFFIDEEGMTLNQTYGVNDWMMLSYDSEKCDGKYKLYNISFAYEQKKLSEKRIKSLFGKPDDTYGIDTYENEQGKVVKEKTVDYDNLSLTYEKTGKDYFVAVVSYTK
ncbi:hypothetical protein [Macrococcoides bohemicum]|uniref:hypothetical protein n=1 Tax=Macrococcoides bohemicum TaxID=1903056 RepID=UPI0028B0E10F|nr:hypothetical protein [Macrococcus bohemicus]